MSSICIFCGGACGRVCRGLGFKDSGGKPKEGLKEVTLPSTAQHSRLSGRRHSAGTGSAGALGSIPSSFTNSAPTIKRGRPLARDRDKSFEATKPWLAEGMARSTWYGRKKAAQTKTDGEKKL